MAAYFALLGFIAFMVGTPGPANLLAMLAGVRQGLRGCIGFICGLVFGKILLNLLIGFGFGLVLATQPMLQSAFTLASSAAICAASFSRRVSSRCSIILDT